MKVYLGSPLFDFKYGILCLILLFLLVISAFLSMLQVFS